ncbi:nucleoside hydrolase [Vibrio genomosp. F10]|uniref:Nucleoside hydrolase n=1 Tax=Vibrio genomosp. F10 TaxID=723171 RepID=A0A1B9QT50_9VIBR|nr:nucleoside hydrolase [Vibrio genomosp. F10]OCH69408.1 nucleoside hydrolase [Vibrio genomosp. F10]
MRSLETSEFFRQPQKRVWVDTDITIGHVNGFSPCDVDDGYALGLLFRSQEIDIVGLSSTLGNTNDIEISTKIATQFTSLFGPTSLRVSKGSSVFFSESQGIDIPDSVRDLAEELKQGPLTILAIGALTNIALLVEHFPDQVKNIQEVVCVAGRRNKEQHFIVSQRQPRPFKDLNFEVDEAAFKVVLNSDIKVTFIPFEICDDLWINFHELKEMKRGSSLAEYLEKHSRVWALEWAFIFGSKQGFIPFDLVAAAYVINPDWFAIKHWKVQIEPGKSDTHKHETKNYLVCNEDLTSGKEAKYAVEITPNVKPEIMKRLAQRDISSFVLGLSHINIIVEDVDKAADYYHRVLGFERALDAQGEKMDYRNVEMNEFNQDAGLANQDVKVDVLFLKHPYASVYLELMHYQRPEGKSEVPPQPKTYDLGGPRHIALEVSNCTAVFNYLKTQEGITMIDTSEEYHPEKLNGFPISFFYWIDKYGVQWEMEEGRRVGVARGII